MMVEIPISEQVETQFAPVSGIVVPDETRCQQCGVNLTSLRPRSGRKARFCSPACREAARLRREQGLAESTPKVRPGGRRRLGQRLQLEETNQ